MIFEHKLAENQKPAVEKTTADSNSLEGRRLLMAEDNDLNAEIAIEILKEAGLMVDRGENGEVVLENLKQAPDNYYDAILMDIQMPKMNGFETTKAIRNLSDQNKANIPIIAMTANAFEEDRRAVLEAGMNSHISKPIDLQLLFNALHNCL